MQDREQRGSVVQYGFCGEVLYVLKGAFTNTLAVAVDTHVSKRIVGCITQVRRQN